MSTVSVKYNFDIVAQETIDLGTNIPSAILTHVIATTSGAIASDSTDPPISKVYSERITLSTATATLDLTALAYASSDVSDVNFNLLKVQFVQIKNNGTGDLVVTQGAADPYFIFGVTGDSVTIGSGGLLVLYTPEGLPDVRSSATVAKNVLFTGTGSETFDIMMVAG